MLCLGDGQLARGNYSEYSLNMMTPAHQRRTIGLSPQNTPSPNRIPRYGTVAPGLSFPLFEMPDKTQPNSRADLGWLTITGDQSGRASWGWFEDGETPPQAGRGAGPVVLYADPRQTAVAISPLTHVAAAVNHYIGTNQSTEGGLWRWGPSGELNSLPAGFRHRTLLVLGAHGVTDAWSAMGGTLQALQPGVAEARRAVQERDPNVNLLSFYTDAGDAYMSGASAELLVQSVHEIRRQGDCHPHPQLFHTFPPSALLHSCLGL